MLDDDDRTADAVESASRGGHTSTNGIKVKKEVTSTNSSPNGSRAGSMSPEEVKAGSDSATTPEMGSGSKVSRKTSQKIVARQAPLADHLPDATEESFRHFQVINDCLYGSKHMGSSEHDALDCDCNEEWRDGENHACGEDSDCINRATKMECVDRECNCGDGCQNQRFQRKQWADVSVIKTEKKGFGLRANTDLLANDFIFEYIGEVINEPTFRRRMMQYDDEGIKHFYFMSLTKSEFVDATKKGNLGRFCNHSCNPNCYVDKWVVGDKLRMGIFAGRRIRAGEELVFNYNVDRYGADPQPCYCGELNCTGYIGGKTQTERATKLSIATIEALGIDDGDSWDTAVAKKPRKKKATEDDEEYVNSVQPMGLTEEGVTKVMAALMQCKEKWIAVKLLARIQECDDDRVHHRVVRMHGYQILKTTLNTFLDDDNVVLQILDILYKFPRLTKNKISDSKIEATIEGLTSSEHEDVAAESRRLLDVWSKLETAYRIPRKKVDPNAPTTNSFEERRNMDRDEDTKKPPDPFLNVVIPKGPRSNIPQRNANFFAGQRPRRFAPAVRLPQGWFAATTKLGKTYYYNKSGITTWERPTAPAPETNKVQSKAQQDQKLQDIIDSLTKEPTPRPSASQTPQRVDTPIQEPKKEKWRSLPIEKQKKIYENTLFPSVKHVVDKFHRKLPKEELKKFGKEINKKLVESDYRHNRVSDPTSITTVQEKKVKRYAVDFLNRAVEKFREHEKRKAARAAKSGVNGVRLEASHAGPSTDIPEKDAAGNNVEMSDVEDAIDTPSTSSDRKRKREEDDAESPGVTPSETQSVKRLKEDEGEIATPPPPPPPPPDGGADTQMEMAEEERWSMREQEEALMRENEEAQRMAEQEEALQRENEEAMRDFEKAQEEKHRDLNQTAMKMNGGGGVGGGGGGSMVNGLSTATANSGKATDMVGLDLDAGDQPHEKHAGGRKRDSPARKREVLSH